MTWIRVSLLSLIVTGLLMSSLLALANVGPIKTFLGGGVVAPEHPHKSIRLESEEVTIRLKHDSYVVDAVFHLFNTGETTTQWTGFPKWAASRTGVFPTFMRFAASVNGTEMPFDEEWDPSGGKSRYRSLSVAEKRNLSAEAPKKERQWLVSRITFPGRAKTTILVTYEAPYQWRGSFASYVYGTGALWKDTIGKAVFMVNATEVGGIAKISTSFHDGSVQVKYARRPISDNVVKYELTDFEPHPEARFYVKKPQPVYTYIQRPSSGPVPLPPPPPMPVRIRKPTDR